MDKLTEQELDLCPLGTSVIILDGELEFLNSSFFRDPIFTILPPVEGSCSWTRFMKSRNWLLVFLMEITSALRAARNSALGEAHSLRQAINSLY